MAAAVAGAVLGEHIAEHGVDATVDAIGDGFADAGEAIEDFGVFPRERCTALFHDRFMDFCPQIKLEMVSQEEVKGIINHALEAVDPKEGLSRKLLAQILAQLPKDSVKAMQDHLLDYLRENTNHLKAYFLPENWDPK